MSTDIGYNASMERGRMLREHGRYDDAIGFLNKALTAQPNSVEALVEKALCELELDRPREAKTSIDRAIGLNPEHPLAFAVKALVLIQLNRGRDGCGMAKQAVSLDPENPVFQRILGQAYMSVEKLDKAEHWLRESLARDPDDETTANLLTTILRRHNRMEENQFQMDRLLERNPENAFTHFNAGWSALQDNDHRQAETHFRESLRLDPNFDEAREGLLQSFRARSGFFRLFLRYSFFMQRLSGAARWALVIGLLFAVNAGQAVLNSIHPGLSVILVTAYLIFVFWGFVANGMSNLIILFDRNARYALRKWDICEAITVGGFFLTGVLMALCAMAISIPIFVPIALGFAAATIPFSMSYGNESKMGTVLFATLAVSTLVVGIVAGLINAMAIEPNVVSPILGPLLLGCMISTWLSGVKAVHR